MKLIMVDEEGNAVQLPHSEVGSATTVRLLDIFGKCVELQRRKTHTYQDAYRTQGYMGNVARVLSKASRLRNMVWSDIQISDGDETVEDTLLDLINLSAFALINMRNRNRWGYE